MRTIKARWPNLIAVLVLTVAAATGRGQTTPEDQATLKGLPAVAVAIKDFRPELEKEGLRASEIQADAEQALRKASIKVIGSPEDARSILDLSVNCLGHPPASDLYACAIEVALREPVLLKRGFAMNWITATTWSRSAIWLGGNTELSSVRKFVAEKVEGFAKAYLEQNPPKEAE